MSNPTIFFVDDEPHVLEALRRLLFEDPFDVRTFTEPKEALEEIRKTSPTLVVADYQMPGMNGPDFLRRVRSIDANIVRMVLTGRPDLQGVVKAVNEGEVYRFVLKPWDDEELRMILRAATDYADLLKERNALMVEVDQHKQVLDDLEKEHPGLTKLPPRDETGAFVLDPADFQS